MILLIGNKRYMEVDDMVANYSIVVVMKPNTRLPKVIKGLLDYKFQRQEDAIGVLKALRDAYPDRQFKLISLSEFDI